MLESTRVHREPAFRRCKPMSSFFDRLRWNACDPRGRSSVPGLYGIGDGIKAGRVIVDKRTALETISCDHMQHAEKERKIGAWPHRQIKICVSCDRRYTRIDHDEF